MLAIDYPIYEQDEQSVKGPGCRHTTLQCCGFESQSFLFLDIPIQPIGASLSATLMQDNDITVYRQVERSNALVLGTSHFGGVGSSPTPVILLTFL